MTPLPTLWNQFCLIINTLIGQVVGALKIKIQFILEDSDCIKASVCYDAATDQYSIKIYKGLQNLIYSDIVRKDIFSDINKFLMEEYAYKDNSEPLQDILCVSSWFIVFLHELGHIINGHFFKTDASRAVVEFSDTSYARLAVNTLTQNEKDLRSLKEFDADSYAGIALGPILSRVTIQCEEADSVTKLQHDIGIVAISHLFAVLWETSNESPLYPPTLFRMLTLHTTFQQAHKEFSISEELPDSDIILDLDILEEAHPLMPLLKKINIALSDDNYKKIESNPLALKQWLQMYEMKKGILNEIHDATRLMRSKR